MNASHMLTHSSSEVGWQVEAKHSTEEGLLGNIEVATTSSVRGCRVADGILLARLERTLRNNSAQVLALGLHLGAAAADEEDRQDNDDEHEDGHNGCRGNGGSVCRGVLSDTVSSARLALLAQLKIACTSGEKSYWH